MIEELRLDDLRDALVALGCEGVVRDGAGLDSAMTQPFQEAYGTVMYPPPYRRAAAAFFFIERAQALVDGNKRLGWVCAQLLLLDHGLAPSVSQAEQIAFALDVSERRYPDIDSIATWLQEHTRPVSCGGEASFVVYP